MTLSSLMLLLPLLAPTTNTQQYDQLRQGVEIEPPTNPFPFIPNEVTPRTTPLTIPEERDPFGFFPPSGRELAPTTRRPVLPSRLRPPSRRPPLSLSFQPTRISSVDQSSPNRYLNYGPSSVIKICNQNIRNRRPCSIRATSKGACERFGCCWDPLSAIRCAKGTYHVVSLRGDAPFSECGYPPNTTVLLDPPLEVLLLPGAVSRIIGGEDAAAGQWPWMILLYEKQNGIQAGLVCGGSLVNSRWIITARHCIITPDPALYQVLLGANNRLVLDGNEQIRDVQRFILNPNFNSQTFDFDITLIEMSTPVEFTEFIRPICVVPANTRTDNPDPPNFLSSQCVTIGWGNITSPDGPQADALQELNVTIAPQPLCSLLTSANSNLYGGKSVQDSPTAPNFCASGAATQSSTDSCAGDSGGPLMCLHDDGRYYLHGITSYGTVPCAISLPGVYTKVANEEINNFIRQNIVL